MDKYEILIAGTGGQGILSIGGLLEQAALLSGHKKVVGGEIHGLAQRGGSIAKHVRIGEDVYGPIIPVGCADVIIGLELVEVIRFLEGLAEDGHIVMSETKIPSNVMWLSGISYPKTKDILNRVKKVTENVTILNTKEIAEKAGNILASNVVVLGAAVAAVPDFPISEESLKEAIKITFKGKNKLIDVNIKAFEMGIEAINGR